VELGDRTGRAVNIAFQQSMVLRGPWPWRTQRLKQPPAGLPRLLVPVCTRTSKGMKLAEGYDLVGLKEVVYEPRTHLAVALKIQKHFEMR